MKKYKLSKEEIDKQLKLLNGLQWYSVYWSKKSKKKALKKNQSSK